MAGESHTHEIRYTDLAGHKRVQNASSEDDAKEQAQYFHDQGMVEIGIVHVTTTERKVNFKAKKAEPEEASAE